MNTLFYEVRRASRRPRGHEHTYSTRSEALGESGGSSRGRAWRPLEFLRQQECPRVELLRQQECPSGKNLQYPVRFGVRPESPRGHEPMHSTRVAAHGGAAGREGAFGCGEGLRTLFIEVEPLESAFPESACLLRPQGPSSVPRAGIGQLAERSADATGYERPTPVACSLGFRV